MRDERAAEHAKKQGRRHHDQEVAVKRLKHGFPVIGASSDLQHRTIHQPRCGDSVIALLIFGNAHPGKLRNISGAA